MGTSVPFENITKCCYTLLKVRYDNKNYRRCFSVERCFLNIVTTPIFYMALNTELAIYALEQVHCWGTYFRARTGQFENFTHLNF
jgi:hypothetical protein